jgi:hypothetical protein
LAAGLLTGIAQADGAPEQSAGAQRDESIVQGWALSGRLGAALFLNSRSLAFEHNVKSSLALRATHPVLRYLELGVGAVGVLTVDPNYGVWALTGQGRVPLLQRTAFQWGIGVGIGAGHNAPILYRDLRAELPIVPYASLSTDLAWRLSSSWWLGVEVASEQLSVVHAGAVIRWL